MSIEELVLNLFFAHFVPRKNSSASSVLFRVYIEENDSFIYSVNELGMIHENEGRVFFGNCVNLEQLMIRSFSKVFEVEFKQPLCNWITVSISMA